jgi:hypothetical protein
VTVPSAVNIGTLVTWSHTRRYSRRRSSSAKPVARIPVISASTMMPLTMTSEPIILPPTECGTTSP